jgi:hypothetical protein
VLQQTMNIQPDEDDPNYARLVSARKDAAVSVMNTALKADENQFKKRNNAVLENLLAEIRKEKQAKTLDQEPVVIS